MESRRRHERCELFQDLERFEGYMGRSVAPPVLEAVQQAAVGQQRETLGGHGRAGAVAGEPLQAPAIACRHADVAWTLTPDALVHRGPTGTARFSRSI
jgi:hypothetical protein